VNLAGIQFPVFNPYGKSTVEIYISGCYMKCPSCHNKELQDFKYGEKLDKNKLVSYLIQREGLFSIVAITGGELLDQDKKEAQDLVYWLIHACPDIYGDDRRIKFWLFTGKEKQDIPDWVFEYFDIVKMGCYKVNKKQEGFPASKNQKVLVKGKDY
jgi:hypothetical protein